MYTEDERNNRRGRERESKIRAIREGKNAFAAYRRRERKFSLISTELLGRREGGDVY